MTDTVLMENHLSSEQIAAFVDGRLPESARLEAITHFADCDECRELFDVTSDAVAAGVTAEQAQVVPFRPRRKWPAIAAVAAVAAVAIVSVPQVRYWFEDQRTGGVSTLVRASQTSEERLLDGRLSGGFPYKPHKTMRGVSGEDSVKIDELKLAALELEQRNPASAKQFHALGLAKLATDSPKDAVPFLEKAVSLDSSNASLLNDLAAVRLAMSDTARALETVERAWSIEKTPEIAWNRALVLQTAGKDVEAIAAWQEYLRLDPKSPWSDEARKKLHDLQNPL